MGRGRASGLLIWPDQKGMMGGRGGGNTKGKVEAGGNGEEREGRGWVRNWFEVTNLCGLVF